MQSAQNSCPAHAEASAPEETTVEYDVDTDDDQWLENINRGQDRLSHQKFELMISKLEHANAKANDRTLSAAGELSFMTRSGSHEL